ncbi:hypothetical protein H6796_02340 [Candidatus Nomurabacteria bacterium]|nr:hypothetical protein [Candidatus Nomurabacteria bacterium]
MKLLQAAFWWATLIITLVIIDDILFGPVFWSLTLVSQSIATLAAFVVSLALQLWLISQAVRQSPHPFARWFLSRLMIERSNKELKRRENSIKKSVTSIGAAFFATLLVGGVIASLQLNKYLQVSVRAKWAVFAMLSAAYSVEFALIHGGWGIGKVLKAVVDTMLP